MLGVRLYICISEQETRHNVIKCLSLQARSLRARTRAFQYCFFDGPNGICLCVFLDLCLHGCRTQLLKH